MISFLPRYRIASGRIPVVDSWRDEDLPFEVEMEESEITFHLRHAAAREAAALATR